MATPIGHALAGYAVYRTRAVALRDDRRALLALCLVMAIAPDFDFLPGILGGQPALYHQGISHSLGFALVMSFGLAVVYRHKGGVIANWGQFSLAYVSHLVIDAFGPDGRPPYGIPFFWPISDRYYLAPVQIFWGVHHASSASTTTEAWFVAIFHPYNLGAIGIEVVVMVPVILLIWCGHSRRGQTSKG
jgi:membrane-bound metal-dependent hydrolase YbcI (DUF457 family)